ncbi:MAG: hypothetical protein GXY86_03280 [Firmicutes bacterium]|nr:hypothetical protein [Bacillota bacterium]
MAKLLTIQQKIVPEIFPLILIRYQILRTVNFLQPIGRRALAEQLRVQERKIRNEVDFLKEQQLLSSTLAGMEITPTGLILLEDMADYIREIQGLSILEHRITAAFPVKEVLIVPGDVDQDETVKKDLARLTADYLDRHLNDGSILAVTGGTTLAEVASVLAASATKREITIVPARGGLGEEVEIQANAVAANIAKGLGANYRLLHVPDDLGEDSIQSIIKEPKIKEILELLRQADMVLHGVGLAEEMARRRSMAPEQIGDLVKRGAVGEAFGYYFAVDGSVVHSTSSVGLQLAELKMVNQVIAVAGGRSKAAAVHAVLSNSPRDTLIIDEGVATGLLEM